MYQDLTTEEVNQIINQGTAAQALLRDDAFSDVINDLDRLYLSMLVATPMGDSHQAVRDLHHAKLTVLHEIIQEITGRATAYELLREQQSRSSDERDDY